jgi:hypothetical protein
MGCYLFATLKEVLVDNDLWLQNTCHDAVLIGHEAGKKGEEGEKRREKKGEEKRKKTRDRYVKIALQIQRELTSTNEILYLLTLSFYLKQGIQDSSE